MHFVRSAGLQTWQPEAQGAHPYGVSANPWVQSEQVTELFPFVVVSSEFAQFSTGAVLKFPAIFAAYSHMLLFLISTYPWAQAEHWVELLLRQEVQGKVHEIQTELLLMKAPG